MPRVNGWEKTREDYGIANKHIWEHKEGMNLMLHENRQEDGWNIVYPDGEEQHQQTKNEALETARDYIKRHPLPEEKYGMFQDVLFKIVLPSTYKNGREIGREKIEEFLIPIENRFGGFIERTTQPDMYYEESMQDIQIIFGRRGEDGVPLKEDEQWLQRLGDRATEELGHAEVMVTEDFDLDIETVTGQVEEDTTGFS